MKKRICLICALVLCLGLAACGGDPAPSDSAPTAPSQTDAVQGGESAYTYEFDGMMGKETAQFELKDNGTCRFSLPGNPVLADVYAGTYVREGDRVTITGLSNEDASSEHATPGLWDWIDSATGDCVITVDEAAHTFAPENGGTGSAPGEPGGPMPGDGGKLPVDGGASKPESGGVAYASNSPAQVCLISCPEGVEKAPVIVLAHGGGFMFGDAGMTIIQPVIQAALEHGYAVVSVDYRKSSEAVFPAALADVKAAVRFVRANAEEYGFDPERIAVWGESAGAYLSLMTALTPDVEELNGDVADNAGQSSAVSALVSFYAPVEFYTLYEEAGKPESAADSFESKFLGQDITADRDATYKTYWETYSDQLPADLYAWVQAGDSDQRVPCSQSTNLAQRLAGYLGEERVEYSLLPGADHEDAAFYTDENLSAVFAWLDGVMGK